MKDIHDSLLEVVALGKNLLQEYKDKPQDQRAFQALITLIRIEKVLDGGRILLNEVDKTKLEEINRGMDEIRKGIAEYKTHFDPTIIEQSL